MGLDRLDLFCRCRGGLRHGLDDRRGLGHRFRRRGRGWLGRRRRFRDRLRYRLGRGFAHGFGRGLGRRLGCCRRRLGLGFGRGRCCLGLGNRGRFTRGFGGLACGLFCSLDGLFLHRLLGSFSGRRRVGLCWRIVGARKIERLGQRERCNQARQQEATGDGHGCGSRSVV
ncbi:MAG: hypothetical protein FJX66_02160 [Alphaproteobacteria bacterium]|nr:hypothetical protein [Alphaproteobacteria bacterium]